MLELMGHKYIVSDKPLSSGKLPVFAPMVTTIPLCVESRDDGVFVLKAAPGHTIPPEVCDAMRNSPCPQ
jgi:hypothetical protein